MKHVRRPQTAINWQNETRRPSVIPLNRLDNSSTTYDIIKLAVGGEATGWRPTCWSVIYDRDVKAKQPPPAAMLPQHSSLYHLPIAGSAEKFMGP